MTLAAWQRKKRVSTTALAKRLGVVRQTVHAWKSGRQFPRVQYLSAIHEITKGKVKAQDFIVQSSKEAAHG